MTNVVTERRRSWVRLVALAAVLASVIGSAQLSGLGSPAASALDLPTWNDVQAAKANEAAAAAKVRQIEGLLAQLAAEVAATKAEADRTMSVFTQTEAEFVAADARFQGLEVEAVKQADEADVAAEQAAILAAQLFRSGGVDQSLEMFLDDDPEAADVLLSRLAMISKATERNATLFETAQTAENNAVSLGKQAEVAKTEREKLKVAAEEAMDAAIVAAEASQAKLAQQQEQQQVLDAQLAALKDTTATTVAGYQERVRIEEEQRREAERRAAEERARQQAAWAAQQPAGGGGGGGGSWVRPSGGWVSGDFGWCNNPYCGGYSHTGTDFAVGCGTPVYASSGGTIVLAGWVSGGGGNMIYLNHPDGSQTRYAHLSAIYAGRGANVGTGQVIGAIGSTGNSTGCHLHFETRNSHDLLYYGFVDPRGFMGARGVYF